MNSKKGKKHGTKQRRKTDKEKENENGEEKYENTECIEGRPRNKRCRKEKVNKVMRRRVRLGRDGLRDKIRMEYKEMEKEEASLV